MAKEALFEESSRGAVSMVTGLVMIVSMVLLIGGIVVLSYGFNIAIPGTTELFTFCAGLVAVTLGFALPFTILPAIGK